MVVNDEIYKNLEVYGGSTINERVYNYLGNLDYTGTISDRLSKFSSEGRNGWQGLIRSGGQWTPAQLFSQGQQGVWLEASPTYKGEQVLWQQSDGTIIVDANGDPVGRADDLSPNGNNATQATSADRPTYNTDGTLHWMAFDGAGDNLKTAGFGLVQPCTIIVAFYPTSIGEFISDGLATNEGSFFIDTNAGLENTLRVWAGKRINSPNTVTYNAWNIGTMVLDGANSIIRLNSMEAVGDAGTANPHGITLGWSGGLAGVPLNGRIAGVVARQGRLSSDEISNAEDELNKLVGGGAL